MAKIIYICLRDPSQAPAVAQAVAAVAARLVPDNLPQAPTTVVASNGIVTGIAGDSELLGIRGSSIAAGYLVEPGRWDQPGSGRPDGAYALFRSDETTVELVSDTLASRTVWYVLTDRLFIASTSQRAIVALLGSFQPNPAVVPWMLATGSLGPGYSWDKRIRCVTGATTVVLDRRDWSLKEHTEPVVFSPAHQSEAEIENAALQALQRAVSGARVGDPGWAITLSGGYDCRLILCLLKNTKGLRAATWGTRAALDDPASDAWIAPKLAEHFGLTHQYYETDLSSDAVESVLDRFVANGEGRIDHISGYADGFSLWQRLTSTGVKGIVRGDQCWGMKGVRTDREARARVGAELWTDFPNLPPLESLDLPAQSCPEWLHQRHGESLETLRDRLYQQFRAPVVTGALADLKLSYVESISPLYCCSLVQFARQLPDRQRTKKALLQRIAKQLSPAIPMATSVAIQSGDEILRSARVAEFLADRLRDADSASLLPPRLSTFLAEGFVRSSNTSRPSLSRTVRSTIKPLVPAWVRGRVPQAPASSPPAHDRLAFRAYLINRTTRLLAEDAKIVRGGVHLTQG